MSKEGVNPRRRRLLAITSGLGIVGAAFGAPSTNPDYLVLVGICTHLGGAPAQRLEAGAVSGLGDDWPGGFFCPCHGSMFDLAGRVYKNVPAPTNLQVPPYSYLTDTRLIIGVDQKGAA